MVLLVVEPEEPSAAVVESSSRWLTTSKSTSTRTSTTRKRTYHYQWLYDRVKGTSKYKIDANRPPNTATTQQQQDRPPCFLCWVPYPVYWLAPYLEMNACMEWVGRRGWIQDPESTRIRQRIFGIALLVNFASLLLTMWSCLAISSQIPPFLSMASFSRGSILLLVPEGAFDTSTTTITTTVTTITTNTTLPLKIFMGLRAVLLEYEYDDQDTTTTTLLSFDEFCSFAETQSFLSTHECDSCQRASFPISISLVLSVVFTLPNITTNFLRMWPNYDVNCQKFFGGVVGLISLFMSGYTWWSYQLSCFRAFRDTSTTSTSTSSSHDEWKPGHGLLFVVAATLLKVIDSFCNWLVPTPSITRNHVEQEEYERMTLAERRMSTFQRLHQFHTANENHVRSTFGMKTLRPNERYTGSPQYAVYDCSTCGFRANMDHDQEDDNNNNLDVEEKTQTMILNSST